MYVLPVYFREIENVFFIAIACEYVLDVKIFFYLINIFSNCFPTNPVTIQRRPLAPCAVVARNNRSSLLHREIVSALEESYQPYFLLFLSVKVALSSFSKLRVQKSFDSLLGRQPPQSGCCGFGEMRNNKATTSTLYSLVSFRLMSDSCTA